MLTDLANLVALVALARLWWLWAQWARWLWEKGQRERDRLAWAACVAPGATLEPGPGTSAADAAGETWEE